MDEHGQKLPATIVAAPRMHAEEIHHPDGRIEHPHVCCEETDIRFRGIAAAAIIIGASLAGVIGAVRLFISEESADDTRPAARVRSSNPLTLPGPPRLEALQPKVTTSSFAASDYAAELRLHQYGPTDDPAFVHVPIEKAMERLADDWKAPQPTPSRNENSYGLVNGGESSSGRMLRKVAP